jgi:Tol biopolymer transport system component/DNA-binding winged helix-turn-helix (wHTH) protein
MEHRGCIFRFADVELNERNFSVTRAGEVLPVEPKVFKVLQFLLHHPDRVVSKDELLTAVWTDCTVSESSLTRTVATLRRLLDDDIHEPRYIATVPTIGYRFLCTPEISENGFVPSSAEAETFDDRRPHAGKASGGSPGATVIAPATVTESGSVSALGAVSKSKRRVYLWPAAAVMIVVYALAGVLYLTRSARPPIMPTLTRLTWDSGLTTDPALSPDGRLLAYASDRSGEGNLDIYIQQIGGGEPLRLTSGPGDKTQPAFSPDGTEIAFHSEESGGIYLVPALGGTPRKLAPEGNRPQFSPDGAWIAYSTGGVGVVGLHIRGLDRMYFVASAGGTPKQVRPDFEAAIYPVWSPDGQHLLFLGNSDASKPAEEAIDWWVTPLAGGPAIKTRALEITREAKLGGDSQGYPWALIAPTWEPDGKGLVFHARSGDSVNLWRITISPTTFKASGPVQRLTSGLTREENPSIASGVKGTIRLAFASVGESPAVWSLPISPNEGKVTGEPRQLTHDAGGDFMPAISRDGNKVVFISTRPGKQEIWIKDLRTGYESELTATRANKYNPIFSPDGSMVAFSESPSWDIYLVPSSGGVAENVCAKCGEVTDWSADGKRIIGNALNGQAWMLDLASRRKNDLLNTHQWTATQYFSPDGRWFDFLVVDKGFHTYIARLDEAPVPERNWIDVMENAEPANWSPDGKLIYVVSYSDGHGCIWARRLDPGTQHPVGEPFPVFHAHRPRLLLASQQELSIAGNKMVLGMSERTGNIWMAEWKGQ